jgi:hypothetical protein
LIMISMIVTTDEVVEEGPGVNVNNEQKQKERFEELLVPSPP